MSESNETLQSRVLCVSLQTSCLGASVLDKSVTNEVTETKRAATGAYKVHKTRLHKATAPFRKLRNAAGDWLIRQTLPGILKGQRLAPSERIDAIRAKIAEYKAEDAGLLEELKANYENEIAADRIALADGFDPSLYPPKEELHRYFSFDLQVYDLPSGDFQRIAGLSDEARAQMQRDHQALITQIGTNARVEVLGKMADLVGSLAERLSNPDFKPNEKTFESLQSYLDQIPALNVTNDPTIAQIAQQAREKLSLNAAALRESNTLKEMAAAEARQVMEAFGEFGRRRLLRNKPIEPEAAPVESDAAAEKEIAEVEASQE